MTKNEFIPDENIKARFIEWIEAFDDQHLRSWNNRLNECPEAAMCEATFWKILTGCGVEVQPYTASDGNSKAPDFFCQKDGYEFYFEATCIRIETVEDKAEKPSAERPGVMHWTPVTKLVFQECRSKTKQCASVDAPCVLGVGTFHRRASEERHLSKSHMEELLKGEECCGIMVDTKHGRIASEPFTAPTLDRAAFLKPGTDDDALLARQPISALIVGAFGVSPHRVYGFLHPEPRHEFDRSVFSDIAFCRLQPESVTEERTVEWI